MQEKVISSGIEPLDKVLDSLRPGDNVVWQIDSLDDYRFFAEPFLEHVLNSGEECVYIRFAPHPPIVNPRPGLTIEEVDPSYGFATFSEEIHKTILRNSATKFFILDNLSTLVEEWATDELVSNFFQITCPFLRELNTIAYFALTRGRHANSVVARIRDTTQVLVDVYKNQGKMYIHPLKVWNRYSAQMYMPHEVNASQWLPIFESGEAAALSQRAYREPLRTESLPIAPWDIVYKKLYKYRHLSREEETLEIEALKQEFSRMLIGRHAELNRLADQYFNLEDLLSIRDRMIGTGRIGGKTTGMLLSRKILQENSSGNNFNDFLDQHDSFYIGSDVFFTFLIDNNLFRQRLNLSNDRDLCASQFEEIENAFLKGSFSAAIMEEFQNMLDYFGQAPIIVRSSSLLEDSFGDAFAGKYRSEFCANQGSPEQRMESFLRAIKLVYASTMSPDACAYRIKRGLEDKDEQMAILVQRVAGRPYRDYFFPALAGVAFSRNPYAWSDAIDPAKGVIRLVFGLGTRAVDRVSNDYPRMIAVNKPEIRPDSGSKVLKYSQHKVDLINIKTNTFMTMPVEGTIFDDYSGAHLYFSLFKDNYFFDPPYRQDIFSSGDSYALTFNSLISRTDFVENMDAVLSMLDEIYGHPVDTEFTASIADNGKVKINLLQCRPLKLPGTQDEQSFPVHLPSSRVLFRADKVINGGTLDNISHIIYISPENYTRINDLTKKQSIGRLVGALNRQLHEQKASFILIGPGRWGSKNLELGINATYCELNNTSVLVEIASNTAGFDPELSYGTHFFQDLVEDQVIYLPVYPDKEETNFNKDFFEKAENSLAKLIPDKEGLQETIKVIDVPAATGGLHLKVAADPQAQKAIVYLG